MTSPRVLLVTYAFPPMAVAEAPLVAKRMGNIPGVTPDVVCGQPFQQWMGRDTSLDEYVKARFGCIRRLRPRAPLARAPLGRLGLVGHVPDPMRVLNRRAAAAVRSLSPASYDVVVTWSQWHSVHLVGRAIRRNGGPPWVAHFSDPWLRNPYVRWGRIAQSLNERLEQSVLTEADALTFTSVETLDLMLPSNDARRTKAHVVPHAFDRVLYPATTGRRPGIVIRHLGRFYGPRTPEPLFRALADVAAEDPLLLRNVEVELIGDVQRDALRTAAACSVPEGVVRVRSAVPYIDSLRLASEADALVLVDAPAERSVFLPSKLIDYLGAERPIICISPPGPASRLVSELGGWVADPNAPGAVAAAIRSAISALRDGTADPGNESVRSLYSVEAVNRQVLRVLNETSQIARSVRRERTERDRAAPGVSTARDEG